MSSVPVLTIDRLTVALPPGSDRRYAVEQLSLEVGAGEIVCVVGESGSGKSVSAFSIMGLLPREVVPVSGSMRLEGEELIDTTEARYRQLRGSRMAMIFQEPMTALDPVRTIGDQIEEVLEVHTTMDAAARRARVLDTIASVHLPDPQDMLRAFPHQLSGGQRQRAMIAGALVLDPALLIADEPTTALDVTTQAQILKLIDELRQRRGTGVLFITHDVGVVADIANRVVVMRQGRIVEQGSVGNVLRRPQHPYTKMLIGAVPGMIPPVRPPKESAPLVLSATKLAKTYSSGGLFQTKRVVEAAKNVDLVVRQGETLGIVGESGSGKSTLARTLVRLVAPTAGDMILHDPAAKRDIDYARLPERKLRDMRRRVQIVFQDPYRSLNPRRTIEAALVEAPMNFGLSRTAAVAKARDLVELVGLSRDVLDRYPHQFSGGQRQRLCIARALMVDPELLIADEAVSALDVSVQAQVLKLLDDLRAKFRLALVFITHDLRVAAQICDRIMVMQRGEVVETGPTAAVFASPQHPYTQALFAAAPGRSLHD
jgi:peptide/nickel transport system ATP-binding protein